MITYSLLPYTLNDESIKRAEIINCTKSASHPSSRIPLIEEFRELFEGSDYQIEGEEISEGTVEFDITDLYDLMDNGRVYISYSDDHIYFLQASLSQALEIGQMICRAF